MLDCAISYFLESVSHKLNLILFPAYLLSYTLTETHKPVLKKKKSAFLRLEMRLFKNDIFLKRH